MQRRKPKIVRPDRGASLRRMLRLLGLLVTADRSIAELANAVDRDVRTVHRDLAALRESGIDVGAVDGTYHLDPETLVDSLIALSS